MRVVARLDRVWWLVSGIFEYVKMIHQRRRSRADGMTEKWIHRDNESAWKSFPSVKRIAL